ncbi:MAG TPA: S41 family peptidase, partial [Draconibacterium sp.]|nr:S41 family peptidase [Draconibacterium sp.]
IAGVYLTRKWFSENTSIPKAPEYSKVLKNFAEPCFTANEFYKVSGRILAISSIKKGFKGKVYVITDNRTSKVSEALVYLLKSEKRATIVGQKTVGSTFLVEQITINKQFKLNLPVAEFYTPDGKTPGKEGIEPDIPVTGEDALKYIQKNLIK